MPGQDPNDMFPHGNAPQDPQQPQQQVPQQQPSQPVQQPSQQPVNQPQQQQGGGRPVNLRQGTAPQGTQRTGSSPKKSKRGQYGLMIVGIAFILIFVFVLVLAAASAGSGSSILQGVFNIEGDLRGILRTIVNIIFGLLDAISLVALVVGGFIYMVSMGDQKEVRKARKILIISGLGLVFVSILWGIMAVMLNVAPVDNGVVVEEANILTQPDPPQGSAPFTVVFDVQGFPSEGYFFSWDFGDGKTGTGKSLSHTYTREGFFDAKVTIIQGETQETEMLNKQILVENTSPISEIIAEPISGRAPLDVNFDASDSKDPNGYIVKYTWEFGDTGAPGEQNTAEGVKVNHVYERDGTYTVTLTVEDNNGETQTASQTIQVGQQADIPIAKISSTPPLEKDDTGQEFVSGVVPFKVSFSGSKSRDKDGEIVSYEWDFGDGSAATDSQTANHTFEDIGTYTVQLSVTDNDGKKDSTSIDVIVKDPAKAPTAVINTNPPADAAGKIKGNSPLTIEFNGGASTDEDGSISLYEWNLGDNSQLQTGETISYTYETSGVFVITLVVKDNDKQASVPAEVTVTVGDTPLKDPVATFTTDPDPPTGYVPFTVDFDASGSYDTDGSIISYEWDFGDNNAILSGAQVTHEFYNPGIYSVSLVVHDNDGLTNSFSRQIAVQLPAPVANIEASRTSGNAPLTVTFDASSSTGNITKYEWDFDDDTKETGRKVTHIFSDEGTYEVELKVSDSGQQVSRSTVTITVN